MFNQRVKELRKARNLTQQELANLVGVTKMTVSGWERGNYTPSTHTLIILARALRTSTDYLLGITQKPTINTEGLSVSQIRKVEAFIEMLKE